MVSEEIENDKTSSLHYLLNKHKFKKKNIGILFNGLHHPGKKEMGFI
jgi:hypothetical protein